MKDKYSYLNDPRAIAEIRKHKWIESQKQGEELGFASAAVDWIQRFGAAWKQVHGVNGKAGEIFLERRRFRRFKLRGDVRLMNDSEAIPAQPLDVSFQGLLCRVSQAVSLGTKMRALFPAETQTANQNLDCYGRVERVVPVDDRHFDLFVSFNECCQRQFSSALGPGPFGFVRG
jgi:hypothetical protein